MWAIAYVYVAVPARRDGEIHLQETRQDVHDYVPPPASFQYNTVTKMRIKVQRIYAGPSQSHWGSHHINTCTYLHARTQANINAHTLARNHACTYTFRHTYAHSCTHSCTRTNSRRHTHTHLHTNTYSRTQMHLHTRRLLVSNIFPKVFVVLFLKAFPTFMHQF